MTTKKTGVAGKVPATKKIAAALTKPRKAKPKAEPLENRILIILDDSGSMSSVTEHARRAFNNVVDKIAEQAKEHGQVTKVSLLKFGHDIDNFVYNNVPCNKVAKLDFGSYYPCQTETRLWDAMAVGINRLAGETGANNKNVSFLVIVVTDGEPNSNRNWKVNGENTYGYSKGNLTDLIQQKVSEDRWSFALQVPPGMRQQMATWLGLNPEAITEWERTEASVRETEVKTSGGIQTYFAARSKGLRSTDKFYATSNIGKVPARKVEKTLTDITSQFKVFTVAKESVIRDFIESKTRKPYVVGSAFYQLIKDETVQPYKEIVVVRKDNGKIYGGQDARKLLGLPDNQTAKVSVGNHGDWDVYVESRSTNRVLPRSTKVLWNCGACINKPSTW